ncbi:MAG: hypothetical protein Ta2C_10790 [Candidatus Endomicrobiellum trichonymphae]|uniref:hypothetical protein n=1 Tax=Endomicrobium trichonymphae TaxID=1408204 RepID=UPI0027D364D6|nr:MAG: hypothetical protein Ta2C_10790 [Candidatus Endomicrobium trichonymphae]
MEKTIETAVKGLAGEKFGFMIGDVRAEMFKTIKKTNEEIKNFSEMAIEPMKDRDWVFRIIVIVLLIIYATGFFNTFKETVFANAVTKQEAKKTVEYVITNMYKYENEIELQKSLENANAWINEYRKEKKRDK